MIATGGRWDRDDWPKYFLAHVTPSFLGAAPYSRDHLLPVNEILPSDEAAVEALIDGGVNLLLDSGVFSLANAYASKNRIGIDVALSLPPDRIDGFDQLFKRYCELVTRWGNKVWGYVEIDQGGGEHKKRTRGILLDKGFRPIPVYHPLADGWDAFDELAETYDRVCFGNVMAAEVQERKRLLATAWHRRSRYPNLWVHLLGVTPSALTLAYPLNSCDSSAMLSSARWGRLHAWAATQQLWAAGRGLTYDRSADRASLKGGRRAWALSGYDAGMISRTMRVIIEDQRRSLGVDPRGTT